VCANRVTQAQALIEGGKKEYNQVLPQYDIRYLILAQEAVLAAIKR
jgi:hypothetical protein